MNFPGIIKAGRSNQGFIEVGIRIKGTLKFSQLYANKPAEPLRQRTQTLDVLTAAILPLFQYRKKAIKGVNGVLQTPEKLRLHALGKRPGIRQLIQKVQRVIKPTKVS